MIISVLSSFQGCQDKSVGTREQNFWDRLVQRPVCTVCAESLYKIVNYTWLIKFLVAAWAKVGQNSPLYRG